MTALARHRRLTRLVAALRTAPPCSANGLTEKLRRESGHSLAVSPRTVKRDIELLRKQLHAPIEYDPASRGYRLWDTNWCLPLDALLEEEIIAGLMSCRLGMGILPAPLRNSLAVSESIQLVTAEPDEISAADLNALVIATHQWTEENAETITATIQGWRQCRTLDLLYQAPGNDPVERCFDPHALFFWAGDWYLRGHCHKRNDWRSLAIRRVRAVRILDAHFQRDQALLDQIRKGRVFDWETIPHATVRVSPEKADLVAERLWFPDQESRHLADGSLELQFNNIAKTELTWWILSFSGHIELVHPKSLRGEIKKAALEIAQKHE